MTHDQILWAINDAAACAAEASLDAFGACADPRMAWEFLRQTCEETDGEVYGEMRGLPAAMPRQFKHDYRRHYRHQRGLPIIGNLAPARRRIGNAE